jgi:hypothetical protein
MRSIVAKLSMLLSVSAVLLATAEARTNLNGTYVFFGDRACTLSSTPFANDASGAPTIIEGPVFRQSAVDTGTFTFNSNGTGIQTGRSSIIDLTDTTVGDSIQSLSDFSVPFTYVVNPDNTLDINFGEGTFTVVLGAGTGNTGTTSPRFEHDQLVNGGSSFIAGRPIDIEQQTTSTNEPGGGSFTQYRLCARSGLRARTK